MWMSVIAIILMSLGQGLAQPAPTFVAEPIVRPPKAVKSVYVTASLAASSDIDRVIKLIDDTELNAIVINVKEPAGERFGKNLPDLLAKLKSKNIWTIARVVVFQSNDWPLRDAGPALKNSAGGLWRDSAGGYWLDPAAREVWQYNVAVAKKALDLGFQEINFDYIRYPSDGSVKQITYPYWDKKTPREEVVADFAEYVTREIQNYYPHAVISADLFAFSFVQDWDLDIGQRAKLLANYFDVLSPMIYPSHYSRGNYGFNNPAEHPYEIVRNTLVDGKKIINNEHVTIRPWIQDFDMGAVYTASLIKDEVRGISDAGYASGFMLWNARGQYTKEAFKAE